MKEKKESGKTKEADWVIRKQVGKVVGAAKSGSVEQMLIALDELFKKDPRDKLPFLEDTVNELIVDREGFTKILTEALQDKNIGRTSVPNWIVASLGQMYISQVNVHKKPTVKVQEVSINSIKVAAERKDDPKLAKELNEFLKDRDPSKLALIEDLIETSVGFRTALKVVLDSYLLNKSLDDIALKLQGKIKSMLQPVLEKSSDTESGTDDLAGSESEESRSAESGVPKWAKENEAALKTREIEQQRKYGRGNKLEDSHTKESNKSDISQEEKEAIHIEDWDYYAGDEVYDEGGKDSVTMKKFEDFAKAAASDKVALEKAKADFTEATEVCVNLLSKLSNALLYTRLITNLLGPNIKDIYAKLPSESQMNNFVKEINNKLYAASLTQKAYLQIVEKSFPGQSFSKLFDVPSAYFDQPLGVAEAPEKAEASTKAKSNESGQSEKHIQKH